MLNNLSSWKNAPLWTKKTIKESTKDWFKYIKSLWQLCIKENIVRELNQDGSKHRLHTLKPDGKFRYEDLCQ